VGERRVNPEILDSDSTMRKKSLATLAATSSSRRVRFALSGVVCALVSCAVAPGCSGSGDCHPEIARGTKFKVTVMSETEHSDGCHVIKVSEFNPFIIEAAKTEPTVDNQDRSVTHAESQPPQYDIVIESCLPGRSDMLSLSCNIEYPSKCDGNMSFSFGGENNKPIDWTAPVIENVYFRIQDRAQSCLPDIANCFDEYKVKLERQ
jgi:hypothetical protein